MAVFQYWKATGVDSEGIKKKKNKFRSIGNFKTMCPFARVDHNVSLFSAINLGVVHTWYLGHLYETVRCSDFGVLNACSPSAILQLKSRGLWVKYLLGAGVRIGKVLGHSLKSCADLCPCPCPCPIQYPTRAQLLARSLTKSLVHIGARQAQCPGTKCERRLSHDLTFCFLKVTR